MYAQSPDKVSHSSGGGGSGLREPESRWTRLNRRLSTRFTAKDAADPASQFEPRSGTTAPSLDHEDFDLSLDAAPLGKALEMFQPRREEEEGRVPSQTAAGGDVPARDGPAPTAAAAASGGGGGPRDRTKPPVSASVSGGSGDFSHGGRRGGGGDGTPVAAQAARSSLDALAPSSISRSTARRNTSSLGASTLTQPPQQRVLRKPSAVAKAYQQHAQQGLQAAGGSSSVRPGPAAGQSRLAVGGGHLGTALSGGGPNLSFAAKELLSTISLSDQPGTIPAALSGDGQPGAAGASPRPSPAPRKSLADIRSSQLPVSSAPQRIAARRKSSVRDRAGGNLGSPPNDQPVPMIKLLMLGDSAVGKSSLLVRLCCGGFEPSHILTIGVDFKSKLVYAGARRDTPVKLQVWDTAGQERFRNLTPVYFRTAMGVLLVFAVDSRASFDNLSFWMNNLTEVADGGIVRCIVGNKCDLAERQVSTADAEALAARYGVPYFETSAKTNTNVEAPFLAIADKIVAAGNLPKRRPQAVRLAEAGGGKAGLSGWIAACCGASATD